MATDIGSTIFADEPMLVALARYWSEKRRGRLIPDRVDIDPLELPASMWPNLLLAEPVPESSAIRYRLVGSAHVERYTFDFTGRTTADVMQGSYRDFMERIYRKALDEMAPVYSESLFRWDASDYALAHAFTRRLMLPVGHGKPDRAAMVLTIQVWPTRLPDTPRSISELSRSGGFREGDYVVLDRDSFCPR